MAGNRPDNQAPLLVDSVQSPLHVMDEREVVVHHLRWTDTTLGVDVGSATLSTEERKRLDRLVTPYARNQFLRCRLLMRATLSSYLGCGPSETPLATLPNGKPVVLGGALHVSLSHAREYVLIGVSQRHPIGVDLEWIDPLADPLPAIARILTPQEVHILSALPDSQRPMATIRHWTRREALLKMWGVGLDTTLPPFAQAPLARQANDIHDRAPLRLDGVTLWDINAGERFAAAVAVAVADSACA
jgi:4'-phosphopantetheinyl transferase